MCLCVLKNDSFRNKFQVFTPDQQSLARFTHYSLSPDVDDFVTDIVLEKIVDGTTSYAWKLTRTKPVSSTKITICIFGE